MGNIVSSSASAPLPRVLHPSLASDSRPAKRRRLTSPSSLQPHQLAMPSPPPLASDSLAALRIEVLKMLHKDSKKVKTSPAADIPPDTVTTRARCRITIFDMTSDPPHVLHCQSQLCDLNTFKNPAGPHRLTRLDLAQPFHVPHESMLVNRPDSDRFDLSDSYQLLIELEAASDLDWPPLDSRDLGLSPSSPYFPTAPPRRWILSSRFDSVAGRLKHPVSLSVGYPSNQSHGSTTTNYLMDVDLRWSRRRTSLPRPPDREASKPCITAVGPDPAALPGRGLGHALALHSAAAHPSAGHRLDTEMAPDAADASPGPSKSPSLQSLASRQHDKVYNLRVRTLSDAALARPRRSRRGSTTAAAVAASRSRVHYILPSEQALCLDFFRCVCCGAYHQSMARLRLHLQSAHSSFDFTLEFSALGPRFRVSSAARETPPSSPRNLRRRGHRAQPFQLFTLAPPYPLPDDDGEGSGQDSGSPWSRLDDANPRPSPSLHPRGLPRPAVADRTTRVLVPKIRQPLFHPISKARLRPGQEVPETKPDDSWLIHKLRDSIGEFSDVTAGEKDYIWEWDGHILRENITSTAYFPRAWISFVRQKAAWLAASERRMLEFGKHSSVLLARDLLDVDLLERAFFYINAARDAIDLTPQLRHERLEEGKLPPVAEPTRRSSQPRRSSNGCALCQLPVLGPTLLVCSNSSCSRRLFHSTCARRDALMPVTEPEWLCNSCCHARAATLHPEAGPPPTHPST